MRRVIILLILCCGLFTQGHTDERAQRVVSVGGDVTEIVYALAADSLLVGVDTSSQYPEAATSLPKVGYQRRLSAEGVLSLNPTLVLASADAGPPAALEQIRQADVRVVVLPDSHTVDVALTKIRVIASAIKRRKEGKFSHKNYLTICSKRANCSRKSLFIPVYYLSMHGGRAQC